MVRRPKEAESAAPPKSRKPRNSGELRPLEGVLPVSPEKPAAEAAPAPDGLNEEQRQRLFCSQIEELQELITEKDEAVAAIRNLRKAMKSDGFTRHMVESALDLQKLGADVIKAQIDTQIQVAAWFGKPLGFQTSLDI